MACELELPTIAWQPAYLTADGSSPGKTDCVVPNHPACSFLRDLEKVRLVSIVHDLAGIRHFPATEWSVTWMKPSKPFELERKSRYSSHSSHWPTGFGP